MEKTKPQVVAALIAGAEGTANHYVTVAREDAALALGDIPPEIVEHEGSPVSQFIIVQRVPYLAALTSIGAVASDSALATEQPTDANSSEPDLAVFDLDAREAEIS